mmetsp:Transcript_1356/g.2403  ORF Transcript_1356/g.2403 Transcript_1356/m.2403 type:complete len:158 (-) Transcript_1356:75-548(-)
MTLYPVYTEADVPYLGFEQKCSLALSKQKKSYKIPRWHTVEAGDPYAIKKLLQSGPVAASISATSPIFRFYADGIIDDVAMSGYNHMQCGGKVNHAVTIVGFGKDYTYDREYFIVKNSFGKDWGKNGYAKIAAHNSPALVLGSCNILAFVAQPLLAK